MSKKLNFMLLIVLAVAVFLVVGCKKDGTADEKEKAEKPNLAPARVTSEYFPTSPGLYKKFNDGEGGWEETVLKPRDFKGEKVVPVKVVRLGAPPDEQAEEIDLMNYTNFYRVTKTNVELVGMESEISEGELYSDVVDPPWVMLMIGMQQGHEWTYEMMNPPGTVKVSIDGFEDVNTRAGLFKKAVRLKLESEYINEGGETEQTSHIEWYAPKVGLIKVKGATRERDAELVETKTVPVE